MLLLLFTGAIISTSRKLVTLSITIQLVHRWYGETYHRGENGTGCTVFPQGRGKMDGPVPYFYIFAISQVYNYICLYIMINTSIVIVSRFPPNIMIIGWIFLTWDQFFLSNAIHPPPPTPPPPPPPPPHPPPPPRIKRCGATMMENVNYGFEI